MRIEIKKKKRVYIDNFYRYYYLVIVISFLCIVKYNKENNYICNKYMKLCNINVFFNNVYCFYKLCNVILF